MKDGLDKYAGRARLADFVAGKRMFTGQIELKAGHVVKISSKPNRNLKERVETRVGDMGVIGVKVVTVCEARGDSPRKTAD